MAIKFLSGLNLSNVTAGSILKLDSNGNIVAATAGTDYVSSSTWSTASNSNIYYNSGGVRIGTYQSSVDAAAQLHVFDYQTTTPKLLIEDGNTGDASMQFKISTQSYTMGIDNSDSDKFILAASSALGTTNVLEVATNGTAAFQEQVLFNKTINLPGDGTSSREVLINAHGNRGKLMKEGNATYWQVAQGGNQFEITDAANGNDTKGNVMLRVHGNDANDNEIYLAVDGGKVGIGTTSPEASMHIESTGDNGSAGLSDYGFVVTSNSTNQPTLGAESIGDGYANLNLGSNISGTRTFWHISKRKSTDSHQLEYYYYNGTGFDSKFTFRTDGSFLANELDLPSGGQLDWANGDARIVEGLVSNYSLSFQTYTGSALTTKMFVSSGGNVGIGTTSPSAKLHVNGNVLIGTNGADETDNPPANFADLHIHTLASGQPIAQDDAASLVISTGANQTGVQGWNGTLWFGNSDYPAAGNANDSAGTQFNYKLAGIGSYASTDTGSSNTGSGDLRFFTTSDTSSPSEKMIITRGGNVGIGTTSPGSKLSVRATTATHQLVSINRPNSDTAALYLGNNSSNDAIISGNNAPISLGKDVSGTYTEYVNIATDGELKFSAYGAGILKTNASGIVSIDTSTYVTDVDWSDIASINGTININSTTQIGQGDTETLVSFQNSGTERGRFEVDDSANSYFVATGFKTSTASTGFLKADGTVDTGDFFGGAYSDLTGTPTLGTAASSAATDFVAVSGDTMTGKLRIDTRLQIGDDTSSSNDYIYDGYLDANSAYFHQPKVIIRSDSSATGGLDEAPVALSMFNRNGTNNTWVKMSFASREVNGSGNTVSIAGIAAQKTTGTANSWASGKLYLWTKNGASFVENMVLQPNGNVGVGTSSPGYKLDVAGTIRSGTGYRTSINGDSSGAVVLFGSASDNDSLGVIGAYASKFNISSGNGDMSFQFNSTERMLLASNGDLKLNAYGAGILKTDANGNVSLDTNTYLTSIPSEYLTETEGDARYVSYESLGRAVPAAGGWYRLAKLSRGGARFAISYTGGNMSPHTYIIDAFKNWNNEATISVEKFGHANYITGFRISRRTGEGNNDYYLEANFTNLSNTHSFEARYQEVLGYTSISEIYSVSSSSTLVASNSDNSERIEEVTTTTAEGLYLQNINLSGRLNLYTDSNTTSTTALVLNGTEVEKRTLGSNAFSSTSFLPLAGGTMTGNINLGDNNKVILGAGSDFEMFHNGSNTYLQTTTSSVGDFYITARGTNHDLYLEAADDIFIRPQGNESGIDVIGNGAVKLYYDGAMKLETTDDGINVPGVAQLGATNFYFHDVGVGDADGLDIKWTLKNPNGNDVTSTEGATVYRLRLVTLGTGTNTGAVYICDNVDGAGWRAKKVSSVDSGSPNSNYPFVEIDGGVPKVTIQHNSTYNVRVIIEAFYGGNGGASYEMLGLDSGITNENGSVLMSLGTTTTEATSVMINASGVLQKRDLGSLAFNSTTLGTAASSAATDFVAVSGDTMTGDLLISNNNLTGLKLTGSNGSYTSAVIANTGSGAATIWFDASNGDLAGSDYAWIRQNNDLNFEIGVDSSGGDMLFTEGGSERMRISSGNVGIGTNSPGAKLAVSSTGTSATPTISLTNTSSATFNHTINAFAPNLTSGENNIFIIGRTGSTKNSGYIGYKYSSAGSNDNVLTFGHWGSDNLMNLTGDGKFGIGTTSPDAKLDVVGNIASTDQISVNNRTAISVGHWAASGSSTGAIRITIPGSHSSNWSMLVLRITAYEYNSTAHTIYYVSGHDWTSGWYNNGVTKIGNGNKDIKLGYDSSKDYVLLGGVSDTWSYGHVTVDVMAHPSFYSSNMDITSGWDVRQTTDISGITTQTVTNKRVLTTSDEGSGNGIDADTVDGLQASSFLRSDANDTASGIVTFTNNAAEPLAPVHITGGGNHTGLYINPAASKQAHVRFATNGTLKWQIRAPFQDSANTALKFYSWVNSADQFVFNHNGDYTAAGVIKGYGSVRVDAAATGDPYFGLYQAGSEKAYIQYVDTGDNLVVQSDGKVTIRGDVQYGQGDEDAVISFKQSTSELAKIDQDGYIYATGFKTSTASTGFLKADGSVDTSTYASSTHNHDSDYVSILGGYYDEDFAWDGTHDFQNEIKVSGASATTTNTTALFYGASGLVEKRGLGTAAFSATGDFAAASHTHSYLPLAGGTLTGDLLIDTGTTGSTTQAYSAFDSLQFNNQYSSVAAGPNKIVMYDDGGSWVGGFGIHDDTTAYYSGGTHKWYKTATGPGGPTFTQKMSLDASGNLVTTGTLSASGYNDSNWNTAYTYSQVGHLPLAGGALTGGLTGTTAGFNSGASYPLRTSSSQRYSMQIRNTGNTVNSNYGWWWFMDTNFNMGFHADGAADRFTLTRDGDLTISGDFSSDRVSVTGSLTEEAAIHINNGRLRIGHHNSGSGVWFDTSSANQYWFAGLDGNSFRIWRSGNRFEISNNGIVTLNNYGAGLLKTNASGVVSVDTSTYLVSSTDISVRNITARDIVSATDRTYSLGTDANRWSVVYCETLDSAGQHESQLQNPEGEKSIGDYATGTVLVWKGGKNIPCTEAADHMRMGIAVNGIDSPLVQGAEPVLVTGSVNEGDYLVTSSVEGHAKAITPQFMRQHMLFDCVIGKALESGEGDSHLIKTWINI